MIEALATNGSDQSFRIRILPGARRGGNDFRDAHAGDATLEHVTIDRVAISQQPSRRRVVWEGVNQLLRRPRRRRMLRDVEVHDPPTVVHEQHEDEQDSAGEGGDGKEIDRHQRGDVIRQEGPPRL